MVIVLDLLQPAPTQPLALSTPASDLAQKFRESRNLLPRLKIFGNYDLKSSPGYGGVMQASLAYSST